MMTRGALYATAAFVGGLVMVAVLAGFLLGTHKPKQGMLSTESMTFLSYTADIPFSADQRTELAAKTCGALRAGATPQSVRAVMLDYITGEQASNLVYASVNWICTDQKVKVLTAFGWNI